MTKLRIIAFILIINFFATSCGTLLYPERRGQTGGRIDPGVAVMDGACLLFFVIPGLLAYAVDFSTGAIYLPETGTAKPVSGTAKPSE